MAKRVLFWGRFDHGDSKTRVNIAVFRALGWDVDFFDVKWCCRFGDVEAFFRGLGRRPKPDLVFVPVCRQRDIAAACRWAHRRGIKVLFDPMISAWDKKVLEQKKQIVADLTEQLQNSVAGVVVDYKGINVADDTALRKELREAGVDYRVVKNTLLGRAIEGTELEGIKKVLEGTTAIAISPEDHVAAARILNKFAEAHENFTIKAGYLDGKEIDLDTIKSLAKLPSREVLLEPSIPSQSPISSVFIE